MCCDWKEAVRVKQAGWGFSYTAQTTKLSDLRQGSIDWVKSLILAPPGKKKKQKQNKEKTRRKRRSTPGLPLLRQTSDYLAKEADT